MENNIMNICIPTTPLKNKKRLLQVKCSMYHSPITFSPSVNLHDSPSSVTSYGLFV